MPLIVLNRTNRFIEQKYIDNIYTKKSSQECAILLLKLAYHYFWLNYSGPSAELLRYITIKIYHCTNYTFYRFLQRNDTISISSLHFRNLIWDFTADITFVLIIQFTKKENNNFPSLFFYNNSCIVTKSVLRVTTIHYII